MPQAFELTPAAVAGAVDGELRGPSGDRVISGFSFDTRTLANGELFFAIRGARDGNAYVSEAVRKGAAAAVVSDRRLLEVRELDETPLVVVSDALEALQRLGRHVRRQSGSAVVAVTGSAGKSTTKEMAAELLSSRYRVLKNKGNLNNHIGLPLSLLELRRGPDIGVFELGMNHSGEISTLVAIAEPDVRVWTNVGPAHLEFFGTVDRIAEAKAEILERAKPDDVLVANADDERVMKHAARFAGRVSTFGLERPADVQALEVRDLGVDGTAALLRTPIGETEIETPLPGTANLSNLLAAVAVALRFDVPLSSIVSRAAELKPIGRRGEIVRIGGVTIIDDSYNSNPGALSKALATMAAETRFSRRIAVIGEMLELGSASADLHRAAGEEAARSGLSVLIAVGGHPARALADGAIAAGLTAASVHYVSDSAAAAEIAASIVSVGDLLLVKGSRGVRTEIVVERLKAERA